jgi:hypothetical protein
LDTMLRSARPPHMGQSAICATGEKTQPHTPKTAIAKIPRINFSNFIVITLPSHL